RHTPACSVSAPGCPVYWVPTFAGMTFGATIAPHASVLGHCAGMPGVLGPGLRRDDGGGNDGATRQRARTVIPAPRALEGPGNPVHRPHGGDGDWKGNGFQTRLDRLV